MKTSQIIILGFFALSTAWVNAQSLSNFSLWIPVNGSIVDESFFNHSIDHTNEIELVKDRFNRNDEAMYFDGISDFLEIAHHNSLSLTNSSFTISLWIKATTDYDVLAQTILSKRTQFNAGNGYLFQFFGSEHPYMVQPGTFNMVYGGSYDSQITGGNFIPEDKWTHLAYTYNQSTQHAIYYLDGVFAGSAVIEKPNFNRVNLTIGKDVATEGMKIHTNDPSYEGGFQLQGALDDIRIYNYDLSKEEVLTIVNEEFLTPIEPNVSLISLAPNPTTNLVNINGLEDYELQRIAIFAMNGQRLRTYTEYAGALDVSNLPQGQYLVHITTKSKEVVLPFQKL